MTVSLNRNSQIAYLGPAGTFSQMAVLRHFGEIPSLVLVAKNSIDEVFASVENSVCNYGVVPVENSTEGAVNNTQDCLIATPLQIIGEVIVPITHNFMANRGAIDSNLKLINRVVSHKQSLAQCRNWLADNFPNLIQEEVASNAKAALLASEQEDTAAIAGQLAAETYGLQIIHPAIQDKSNNSTRFLVLARELESIEKLGKRADETLSNKTSVLIYTDNKPGALFRILEPFERLGISLSKIETRPSKIEAWEYVFFVDFEGHAQDEVVQDLFSRLDLCTAEVKMLGSYPKAERDL